MKKPLQKVLLTVGVLGTAWLVWRESQKSPTSSIVRHLVGQDLPRRSVREAQHLLRRLGYDVFEDGVEGPRTRAALKKFQSLHDLDIDGFVGPRTLEMLRAEVQASTYARTSFAGFGPMASGAVTPNMIGSS
jgi:peptidoglycan hydrolase-like protein with peptidoglycan-binding domain